MYMYTTTSATNKMSSTNQVIQANHFSIENVSFKEPRKNAIGGQSILLNYMNDKKSGPLIMQTPKMRIPFGPDISESDTGVKKFSINTSLAANDSTNTNLIKFTEVIRRLDEHTKKFASDNSEEWFGKKQKPDVLEEFYKSAEKKSKMDKYPSTLKLKLPVKMNGDKSIPQFDL